MAPLISQVGMSFLLGVDTLFKSDPFVRLHTDNSFIAFTHTHVFEQGTTEGHHHC